MSVSALGVRPSLPSATAIGVTRPRTRARVSGETSEPLTRRRSRPASWRPSRRDRSPDPAPRVRDGERLERLGIDGVDGLAALRAWPSRGPTSRSLPRCHATSGWRQPTCAMSSVTVAGASARRRTMRSRLASASTLWTRRSSRRSSGWSTTDAIVLRMRAGEGDTRRFRPLTRGSPAIPPGRRPSHQRRFISTAVDAIRGRCALSSRVDAGFAASDADVAAADANAALDHADWAVDNARLAILDAIDARAYADERAAALV